MRARPLPRVLLFGAVLVACTSCRGERVSSGADALASECGLAAGIYFELRAAAGDYDRDEGRRRAKVTEDDLKRSCGPAANKVDCCAASQRL